VAALSLYAKTGIREYWLVDIQHKHIKVHREIAAEGYQSITEVDRGYLPLPYQRILAVVEVLDLLA
jgi:Uma2 family endonuclease